MAELIEVREDERFDPAALADWLAGQDDLPRSGTDLVKQFQELQSVNQGHVQIYHDQVERVFPKNHQRVRQVVREKHVPTILSPWREHRLQRFQELRIVI